MVDDQPGTRGRPSKYTPELQIAADWYADNWDTTGDVIPSQVGLACHLNVSESTVSLWATQDDKPRFSETLATINARQHKTALNKGLTGDFTAPITKLVLHNHGYSDKSQQELSGPGGKPIEVDSDWNIYVHEVPNDA